MQLSEMALTMIHNWVIRSILSQSLIIAVRFLQHEYLYKINLELNNKITGIAQSQRGHNSDAYCSTFLIAC